MDDKCRARRRAAIALFDIGRKREGVCPTKPLNDSHRKAAAEDVRFVGIVMEHRSDAVDQVLDRPPEQPDRLWNLQVLSDRRSVGMVDVFGPGSGIGVRPAPESREQIELQVIVRVDQAGKHQHAAQVQHRPATRVTAEGNSALSNRQIDASRFIRIPGNSRSAKNHGRIQTASQRAGTLDNSANIASRPAVQNR